MKPRSLFSVAVLVLCLIHLWRAWIVLSEFSFQWLDDDQALMWLAMAELSRGNLPQPHFYGQNYNTHLEGYLALPLWLTGLAPWQAVPIVTLLLSLAPFAIISVVAYRSGNPRTALLIASIPLLLSPEYAMVSAMPRGFVTGIAVFVLGWWIIDRSSSRKTLLLGATVCTLSLWCNPNSTIVGLAVALALLVERRPLLPLAGGAALGGVILGLVQSFYLAFPDYSAHHPVTFRWRSEFFWEGLTNPDRFFGALAPVFHGNGPAALGVLLSVALLLAWQRRSRLALAILITIGAIFVTLGVSKVHDGYNGIYQPLFRMYLALPVLLALGLLWLARLTSSPPSARVTATLSLVWLLSLVSSLHNFPSEVRRIAEIPEQQVRATKVSRFLGLCEKLKELKVMTHAELVVFGEQEHTKMLAYGCPVVLGLDLQTLFPEFERRTWLLHEESVREDRTRLLFWFLEPGPGLWSVHRQVKSYDLVSTAPRVFFVETEPISVTRFIRELHLPMRRFRNRPKIVEELPAPPPETPLPTYAQSPEERLRRRLLQKR